MGKVTAKASTSLRRAAIFFRVSSSLAMNCLNNKNYLPAFGLASRAIVTARSMKSITLWKSFSLKFLDVSAGAP
ncbi:unnamed protein product, partial [Ixodes pacificus]